MKPKCKRCSYVWLPMPGAREIPRNGNTYWTDMGICPKCDHAISRIHVATPGDMADAMLFGRRFEAIRRESE